MARVRIEKLSKRFDGKPPAVAANELDLDIEDGEFVVLLGPSGCGKTTTLRCLAGLEQPDSGRILFDDRPVFDGGSGLTVPPERRSIGMVFQSYALWPHLTVRKNIEYPLKARKVRQGLKEDWTTDTARLVDCEPLLERVPSQLSGGQQQRVALARGLVSRPDLVLFDEPLSNLDARLRDTVRTQMHELHQRLGFTAVFVTHDQAEAFALGDRLVVLRQGQVEQIDSARAIWAQPATDYVAEFIGMSNRIELTRIGDGWQVGDQRLTDLRLAVPRTVDAVAIRARPDDLAVVEPEAATASDIVLSGSFIDATFAGSHLDVSVDVAGRVLRGTAPLTGGASWIDTLELGAPVRVQLSSDAVRYYPLGGTSTPGQDTPADESPERQAEAATSSVVGERS